MEVTKVGIVTYCILNMNLSLKYCYLLYIIESLYDQVLTNNIIQCSHI